MLLPLSGYHKAEFVKFEGVAPLGKRQTFERHEWLVHRVVHHVLYRVLFCVVQRVVHRIVFVRKVAIAVAKKLLFRRE